MDRNFVIQRYIEHVLEHGDPPASVFKFARDLNLSERDFFNEFASFEVLEASIWRDMVKDTVHAVTQGEEWNGFSAHERLLTFYFAFFEKALDRRSLFLARFPRIGNAKQPPTQLRLMRDEFCEFAKSIIVDGVDRDELPCRGRLNDTYPSGMFLHFLSAVEFNLNDDSSGFERTDAYIEKSVKLGFDLIGNQALDSAVDLARFLTGRSWGKKDD